PYSFIHITSSCYSSSHSVTSYPTRRSSDLSGRFRGLRFAVSLERRRRCASLGQFPIRRPHAPRPHPAPAPRNPCIRPDPAGDQRDRKSTRLNSSHVEISYAVFCLKKKKYDC